MKIINEFKQNESGWQVRKIWTVLAGLAPAWPEPLPGPGLGTSGREPSSKLVDGKPDFESSIGAVNPMISYFFCSPSWLCLWSPWARSSFGVYVSPMYQTTLANSLPQHSDFQILCFPGRSILYSIGPMCTLSQNEWGDFRHFCRHVNIKNTTYELLMCEVHIYWWMICR